MKSVRTMLAGFATLALALGGCTTTSVSSESETSMTVTPTASAPSNDNLAYGKYASSNNHIFDFTADRAFDGEVLSYWEGASNTYPNDLVVDLGKTRSVGRLVVKLNPKRIWSPRTQTIEVLTSADGTNFETVLPAQGYDFDPIDSDNSVTIPLSAQTQFLKLRFTANTEANAGQVAELEVYEK